MRVLGRIAHSFIYCIFYRARCTENHGSKLGTSISIVIWISFGICITFLGVVLCSAVLRETDSTSANQTFGGSVVKRFSIC